MKKWKISKNISLLPYKQRVGGSNPSTPTVASEKSEAFFVPKNLYLHYKQRVEAVRRLASNREPH